MKRSVSSLATASVLSTALVSTALLAPAHASAATPGLPFRASYSGTAVFTADGTPLFTGSGQATHLGAITSYGTVVFTTIQPPCAGGIPNDNTETLTAANGDKLVVTSADVACPTGPYRYHGTGQWSVDGKDSTGRFVGATGGGAFDGHSDFAAQTFDITLDGTVSLAQANS